MLIVIFIFIYKKILIILLFFLFSKKMRKNVIPECDHIIRDNYYCETCGTLCYNNVN